MKLIGETLNCEVLLLLFTQNQPSELVITIDEESAQYLGGAFGSLKGEDILPLPAPPEEFLFLRHIKTKSEDGNHLSITNCNQAYFAKLARRGLQEESGD